MMVQKRFESSQQEKQHTKRGKRIATLAQAKVAINALANHSASPDAESPEITDFSSPVIGRFYRPTKERVTIRFDSDLLNWLKHQPGKYQTLINQVCRQYMDAHQHH